MGAVKEIIKFKEFAGLTPFSSIKKQCICLLIAKPRKKPQAIYVRNPLLTFK